MPVEGALGLRYRTGRGLRAAKCPRILLLNYSYVKCLSFVRSLDWTPETRAVLTFMSRPKDVKNAKFCAESKMVASGVSETGSMGSQFQRF